MLEFRARLDVFEPCLPSPAKQPPTGPNWLHEIKHDDFHIMSLQNAAGVRLFTRNGHDLTKRFPLVVALLVDHADALLRACMNCLAL